MDFHSVLSIASEKKGLDSLPKRYSLKPGPPKKDPKVKGVNSSAVQAFLKRQEHEQRKKDLEKKRQKEELLAKRVELKSDRKARAMASRTKDNFKGYNGVPVVDQPKKRLSKGEKNGDEQDISDDYYDDDNYEYAESEPESEPELAPVRSQKGLTHPSKMSSNQKKITALPKAAPSSMNFADLLKLAEKKQFEPVELKPVKKPEERLRTAEEMKEFELERKVKRQDIGREIKTEKYSGHKDNKSVTNSHKKNVNHREIREGKSLKSPSEKLPSGICRTAKPSAQAERPHSFTKSSNGHGLKPSSSFSGSLSGKIPIKGTSVSLKQTMPRAQSGGKPSSLSDLSSKKEHSGLPQVKKNSSVNGPKAVSNASRQSGHGQAIKGSGQPRPGPNNVSKGRPPPNHSKGELSRSMGNFSSRPGTSEPLRSALAGSSKQVGAQPQRPGGSSQNRPLPAGTRPSVNGPSKSSKPINSMGQGPVRSQCTVVSETISSKSFAPKQGMASRPSVPQGPRTIIGPTGHRILARPTEPTLPPITSSYKRKHEDEEEYDSEMDDFIDDEGEDQDEVSKHIREIFGYDRNRYKDESDYALKFMESSWKEQQKEEARSLRLAVFEDQEEEQRELEEMKQKQDKRRKLTLRLGMKEDEEDMRMEEEEMKKKQAMKEKRKRT